MFQWVPYAFVRIVIFFIAGILLGIYQPELLDGNTAAWILSGLMTIYFVLVSVKAKNLITGMVGLMALVLAGYLNLLVHTDSRLESHIINESNPIEYYQVVITKAVEEKENSWKLEASIKGLQCKDSEWKESTGKILLYFPKKDYPIPYQYGDILLIKGAPREIEKPANPGEFDYKRFLSYRKIYHQHFVKKAGVQWIGKDPPNKLIGYATKARVWADSALKKYIAGEREQAIASALVLGVTDGLDDDLLNAYSASGAMHVLAVSGLHVGIIYWIILLVLRPLNKSKSGKWLLAGIGIIILWSYAFVTGLSPSVLRAVTMFSFVALARPIGYKTNIYNILATSAFCLLLCEPYLIMSVGFQLSYLAVLGIVYLQPGIYRLWEPTSVLWDNIWKITCVSIAAQAATFSVGLLYFHQFPVYFLFSNLIVIPGSFVVLVAGIVLVGTSVIDFLGQAVGFFLTWAIKGLNFSVFLVEDLPYSLIENIYITTLQCLLLMAMTIGFMVLIKHRKFSHLIVTVCCTVLFGMAQWYDYFTGADGEQFVVYRISGHSAYEFMFHGKSYFFADSVLSQNQNKIRFHIRPNRLQNGVKEIIGETDVPFAQDFESYRVLTWNEKVWVHVGREDIELPPGFQADYLILSNNAIRDLRKLSGLNIKKVIIDSSNTNYLSNKLLEQAKLLSIDAYSVNHFGAYITQL